MIQAYFKCHISTTDSFIFIQVYKFAKNFLVFQFLLFQVKLVNICEFFFL